MVIERTYQQQLTMLWANLEKSRDNRVERPGDLRITAILRCGVLKVQDIMLAEVQGAVQGGAGRDGVRGRGGDGKRQSSNARDDVLCI